MRNYEVKNGKVYNKNGEIAVIISPDCGWATKGHNPFCPKVALYVLGKISLNNEDLEEIFNATKEEVAKEREYMLEILQDLNVLWVSKKPNLA